MPTGDYLRSALELCRKYGTLFIADEVQTGLELNRTFPRLRALGYRA